jgi:hypothetical protein
MMYLDLIPRLFFLSKMPVSKLTTYTVCKVLYKSLARAKSNRDLSAHLFFVFS